MHFDSPIFATLAAARAEGLPENLVAERVWGRHGMTCAMLALDSSGMMRTSHALGIVHFLDRFMQARAAIEPLLAGRDCLGWRCFADNLFAEFLDTDSALATARAMHAAIRERGLMLTDDEPFRVGLAVGHGHVLENGRGGVMGAEMNLVAKLAEDVAAGGETLITESARASLGQLAGLEFEPQQRTISGIAVRYFRLRG